MQLFFTSVPYPNVSQEFCPFDPFHVLCPGSCPDLLHALSGLFLGQSGAGGEGALPLHRRPCFLAAS